MALVYRDLIYQKILPVSQWSYYCYVIFCEVANHTCRNSLCNILMIISEYYGFNLDETWNDPCKTFYLIIIPICKERKEKILKLGDY